MKRKKYWAFAVIIIFIALLIWGFFSMGETVIIRYAGNKVFAVVIQVPTQCDKYNHIKVLFDGLEHEVGIGREECNKGVYKIGQQVELLKHDSYDDLVWPDSRPELVIVIVIVVLIFGYLTVKNKYNK